MGEAAEASKTLHNWMGEPGQGEGRDDEERTLQLCLGLPGGGGGGAAAPAWRRAPGRDKGSHPAAAAAAGSASLLSLGYSNAAALSPCCSQGKAKGSPAQATGHALPSTNNTSQTRSPNAPVIGWPPVRTFRRNLATSSKAFLDHQSGKKAAKPEETTKRAPFIKINMDGIPIGRKIDLNALDSYENLSLAVDKLFRGLLAAQQDPLAAGPRECPQEEVAISGLLDGTGDYTLVYEDYEGDRVLVGDVPWGMFVSSVKRLRVLKTSDLSSSLTASGRKRAVAEC
ncbi:auxin-responsive protein IAA7-like isoform X2 [Panicum virgatum]|nr:auxin-responsive protein IAA7-like isoform X2 [Panicum virgatum]